MKRWAMITINLMLALMIILILAVSKSRSDADSARHEIIVLAQSVSKDSEHLNMILEQYDDEYLPLKKMTAMSEYVRYYENCSHKFRELDALISDAYSAGYDDPFFSEIYIKVHEVEKTILMNIAVFKHDLDAMAYSISVAGTDAGREQYAALSDLLKKY